MSDIISFKVDTNDADYRYFKRELDPSDKDDFILFVENGLKKFKPYTGKKLDREYTHRHNFPSGGLTIEYPNSTLEFSTHRPDIGGLSNYQYYVGKKMVSRKVYETFAKYIGNKTFHTIHQIKINKVVIFKKGW